MYRKRSVYPNFFQLQSLVFLRTFTLMSRHSYGDVNTNNFKSHSTHTKSESNNNKIPLTDCKCGSSQPVSRAAVGKVRCGSSISRNTLRSGTTQANWEMSKSAVCAATITRVKLWVFCSFYPPNSCFFVPTCLRFFLQYEEIVGLLQHVRKLCHIQ